MNVGRPTSYTVAAWRHLYQLMDHGFLLLQLYTIIRFDIKDIALNPRSRLWHLIPAEHHVARLTGTSEFPNV
jgi:hypothetical protein